MSELSDKLQFVECVDNFFAQSRQTEVCRTKAGSYHLTATHVLMSTAAWQLPAPAAGLITGSFLLQLVRRIFSPETAVSDKL